MTDIQTTRRPRRASAPSQRHPTPPPARPSRPRRRTVGDRLRRLLVRYPTLTFSAGVLITFLVYALLAVFGQLCIDNCPCR